MVGKKYKAVLFDMDGTINESGTGFMRCVQYALDKMGLPEADESVLRTFIGPPLKDHFMDFVGLNEEDANQAVRFFRERYGTIGLYENGVYDGVEEMLKELKAAGYMIALASSKPEIYVRKILAHYELDQYFTEMVGSEMNGDRWKKAEVIEETLNRLGLAEDREYVLMVGDREHDIFGARQAGIDCMAAAWGYGSREELQAAGPVKIADHPMDVAEYLR